MKGYRRERKKKTGSSGLRKYIKVFTILLFTFAFIASFWLDLDNTIWPFESLVLGDTSSYIKYLAYNRGTDFTVFSKTGVDSDVENHNFFILSATPKSYNENDVAIAVNKNGSVTVKGTNAGTPLEIPLNGKTQLFPEGEYYFSLNSDSPDDMSKLSTEWIETIEPEDSTDHIRNILTYSDNQGEINCVDGAQYTCMLIIPAGADIPDGVTFNLTMKLRQSDEVITDSEGDGGENLKTAYIRAIYPYESQKYGKVFTIQKNDFLSLSAKEWSVFQNNIRYLYFPKYTYVSILFEDGTGIQFDSSDPNAALSGVMDSSGVIVGEPVALNTETIEATGIVR